MIYFSIGRSPKRGEVTACEPPLPNAASSNAASSNAASSNAAGFDEKTKEKLNIIAAPARCRKRMSYTEMSELILHLCETEYLSMEEMANLLDRDMKSLRNHYISKLISEKLLQPKYPTKNHPNQRYRSIELHKK